jgi:hypothetical protein
VTFTSQPFAGALHSEPSVVESRITPRFLPTGKAKVTLTLGEADGDSGEREGDGEADGDGEVESPCVGVGDAVAAPPIAGAIALIDTSLVHAPAPVDAVKPMVAVALPSTAAISTASVCE